MDHGDTDHRLDKRESLTSGLSRELGAGEGTDLPGDAPCVTFVIPAYNEEAVIRSTLETAHRWFIASGRTFEIVPIDDGSDDNTFRIAEEFARAHPTCRPLRNGINRGKGFTVRRGIEEARGEFVLFSDADLSTPIEEAEKLLGRLEEGFDIVIGSRDLPDSDVRVRQPWYRETMGKIFNRIVRLLVVGGFHDTQCGFKAFRKAKMSGVTRVLRIDTFSFDVEIIFVARRFGLRIVEEPVIWLNNPDTRVNALTDAVRMFIDLFLIRYYSFKGCYGKPARGSAPVRNGKVTR